jgi:hypothetical protein
MDPFPALYEAFLYAAKAAPGLQKESFLEQARRFIAEGKLQARGRRFSPAVRPRRTRWPLGPTQEPWDDRVGLPVEPPALVRIPQTAMADHQLIFIAGPKTDCWATLNGSHTSGWKDVRGVAGDIERLWPHTATSPGAIAANSAGQIKLRQRGPKPVTMERVKTEMKAHSVDDLSVMKIVEMASKFTASPDTCRRAREEILAEK